MYLSHPEFAQHTDRVRAATYKQSVLEIETQPAHLFTEKLQQKTKLLLPRLSPCSHNNEKRTIYLLYASLIQSPLCCFGRLTSFLPLGWPLLISEYTGALSASADYIFFHTFSTLLTDVFACLLFVVAHLLSFCCLRWLHVLVTKSASSKAMAISLVYLGSKMISHISLGRFEGRSSRSFFSYITSLTFVKC